MSTEARIQELYGLPLGDFVTTRNELARELKDEGQGDDADEVRSLSKPSVAAWAVNQLARSYPEAIDELLELRERLRSSAGAAELRDASTKRHQAISDLVDRAGELLKESGNAASSQTLAKVSATLYGGSNEEELAALKNGTLTHELQPAGFDEAADLDWSLAPPDEEAPAASKKAERARAERERLEAELEEAERSASSLAREATRARRAADVAETQAENAAEVVERLRARLERG